MTREKKLLVILLFNFTLMIVEVIGGILSRSLALISDAGHMLTDSMALFLSYLAIHWSKKPATLRKTFGYHRTEVLVAMVNGMALLLIAGYIFYEAVQRFFHPVEIKTDILLGVAVAGLMGNVFGVLILRKESHENINIRGAFLHLLGDMLSSIGVIAGGLIIVFTGWNVVDSLIGILIGGIVLRGALGLIMESTEVLLESTPRDIDVGVLRRDVEQVSGVKGFHEIHVWTITSGRRALSGHVLVENMTIVESQKILCEVRGLLADKFNVTHTTLEVECEGCTRNVCEFSSEDRKGH